MTSAMSCPPVTSPGTPRSSSLLSRNASGMLYAADPRPNSCKTRPTIRIHDDVSAISAISILIIQMRSAGDHELRQADLACLPAYGAAGQLARDVVVAWSAGVAA